MHRRSPTKRKGRWPHTDTFVRLMRSQIHGIGVFAIRPIPKGASVFGDHYDEEIVEVPARVVARTRGVQRAFYDDFTVLDVSVYRCPKSFNLLTPSWYLNHSDSPNVTLTRGQRFIAARRIRAGEELVVDYRTFSNDPMPWRQRSKAARS